MMDYINIFALLDENGNEECQTLGMDLARKEKDIEKFILPMHPVFNKNIWNNCARVIFEKTDQELKEYLPKIFVWLQDLTWPGSMIILERLKKVDVNILCPAYVKQIETLFEQGCVVEGWIENLSLLMAEEKIAKNLPEGLNCKLKKIYRDYMGDD